MSTEIPEPIKNNIRIVLSKSGGVTLPEFLSDYRTQHGKALEFRKFGFSSVQEFMKSIPDVVSVETGKDSLIRVFGVAELKPSLSANSYPSKAQESLKQFVPKASQLENDSNVNGMPTLIRNGVETDEDSPDLIPDYMGYWSVLVPLSCWRNRDPQDLVALFRQAGDVKKSMFTEKQAFIRYSSLEEALVAMRTFSDLKVRLARNHFKNPSDQQEVMKKHLASSNSGNRLGTGSGKPNKPNSLLSEIDNTVDERNTAKNKDSTVLETLFGKFYKDLKLNENHSEMDNQSESSSTGVLSHKDGRRPPTDSDLSVPRKTLYFGNIESVDDFREMIKPYDPVSVDVKMRDGKTYAFVNMKSIDCARQAIKNLRNIQQKTQRLFVNFAKRSLEGDNDSASGENSFESQQDSPRVADHKKKVIEMPPLVPATSLGPDGDRYQLECCIYVAYFPCNTLESVLRSAFKDYHVLDVCMVNNGSGPGCTKAFLYLTTVYDVIQAVIQMNNSCIFERPLQVEVPYNNMLLKTIVQKAVAREKASSHH